MIMRFQKWRVLTAVWSWRNFPSATTTSAHSLVSHIAMHWSIKIHHSHYCRCTSLHFHSPGLSKLHCLKKLSLDENQLSSLDALVLDQLPNLSFLFVENNSISSLHGIQRVCSLVELYIGNNNISMSQDIYCLKVSRRGITMCFGFLFFCLRWYAFFLSGIDKPHYSGPLWESFIGETGKLSNLHGVPPTIP